MFYNAAIEILKQTTFLSALLCGFSLTYLIGLFQLNYQSAIYKISISSVALATCTLLISTVAGIAGIYWLTERPALMDQTTKIDFPEYLSAFQWSVQFLVVGLTFLLFSIAFSGWLKSRTLGMVLSILAFVTFILLAYFLVFLVGVD